jgi:hypothetical protein
MTSHSDETLSEDPTGAAGHRDQATTLADALPLEMARVRDELLPEYRKLGPAGAFGQVMLCASLDEAAKALVSGDVVRMLRAYQVLKESQ